jgi:hypothetical protein
VGKLGEQRHVGTALLTFKARWNAREREKSVCDRSNSSRREREADMEQMIQRLYARTSYVQRHFRDTWSRISNAMVVELHFAKQLVLLGLGHVSHVFPTISYMFV